MTDLEPFACVSDPARHAVTYPNGDQVHAFALCFAVRTWSSPKSRSTSTPMTHTRAGSSRLAGG
ncbi:hypothetical protein [Actinopolymorpha pittospori]